MSEARNLFPRHPCEETGKASLACSLSCVRETRRTSSRYTCRHRWLTTHLLPALPSLTCLCIYTYGTRTWRGCFCFNNVLITAPLSFAPPLSVTASPPSPLHSIPRYIPLTYIGPAQALAATSPVPDRYFPCRKAERSRGTLRPSGGRLSNSVHPPRHLAASPSFLSYAPSHCIASTGGTSSPL